MGCRFKGFYGRKSGVKVEQRRVGFPVSKMGKRSRMCNASMDIKALQGGGVETVE